METLTTRETQINWYKSRRKEQNQDPVHHQSGTLESTSAADYYQRALTQIKDGQYHEATLNIKKCLSLDPEFTEAHIQLGGIYQNTGQIEESDKHLRLVLDREPYHIEALVRHGSNLVLSGNIADAQKCFESAIGQNPDNPYTTACLAGIHVRKGNFDKALEAINPFLTGISVHESIALVFAEACKYANRCDEATSLLEDVIKRPELQDNSLSNALFALGKLYDGSMNYEKAFECFSKANNLKHYAFDVEKLTTKTDSLITTWNLNFQLQLTNATARFGQSQPIFIVGMPRSGTTLVEQILSRHPGIYGAGELKYIPEIIRNIADTSGKGGNYPECLQYADKATLDTISGKYLDKLALISGRNSSMVTDKLPGNFWHLGLIKLLFPFAKIIHCERDPLDTCLSNYFTNFSDGCYFSFDLENAGIYYRQYEKIMAHWKNNLQLSMLNIKYEDLVQDQNRTCRKLIDYCGLEWDERCLSPHKNRRAIATSSFSQVRAEIYSTSIERWRHYDKHLGALRKALDDHNITTSPVNTSTTGIPFIRSMRFTPPT